MDQTQLGQHGRTLEKKEGEESKAARAKRTPTGLEVERFFTTEGTHPYDEVGWDRRSAVITGQDGAVVFEQKNVEVPKDWSQTATNIVVQKYFRGLLDTPGREQSVRELFDRVVNTIAEWGKKRGYFRTDRDAETFNHELKHLLVHQKASFNSPVWFNVGVDEHPQCSACFINSVEDTMDSILQLVHTEGMLFKWGSGTGTNFSTLRSSRERLVGGGTASGPVSFMRGYDAFAGVIKSGGKTRRAAKMVILNIDHPDIEEFIQCKAAEEKKAWTLIDAGYDGSFGGEAYSSIMFQNSNNSVRVSDAFMEAVVNDDDWDTRAVTEPSKKVQTYKARHLMRLISEAAHQCGDPGLQFDSTVNAWHTCPNSGRINASNPCSEFMFLDNSACNLASLNLRRFQDEEGELDVKAFCRAIDLVTTAQDILVDDSRYPIDAITRNSHDFRPLGLGYANLGALLMSRGVPYDSDPGRAYAAAVTALLTGRAYRQSILLAQQVSGPFRRYPENEKPFMEAMRKHRRHLDSIDSALVPYDLTEACSQSWDDVVQLGTAHGLRNAQVTVLAPTGTIGFMMDCDTTGIEPDIALVKYKQLVGGGTLKLVNNSVRPALKRLGYNNTQIESILNEVDVNDTIESASELKEEHLPVFDCALKPKNGKRSIDYMGHLRMMAAVQPFLSGAISKTVNLPNEITVEEIEEVYVSAWRMGLKAVALYRDGCKKTQPLMLQKEAAREDGREQSARTETRPPAPVRRRLPQDRVSITHKFEVAGHEGYLTVGYYDNGSPGEIFIRMAKEGSTISGLMDSFATAISLALQHGVELKLFCDKFSYTRFEPSGFTNNREIPMASSLMDYIFRYMAREHLEREEHPVARKMLPSLSRGGESGYHNPAFDAKAMAAAPRPASDELSDGSPHGMTTYVRETDAPACPVCGFIMVRNGACYKCENCGATNGCS